MYREFTYRLYLYTLIVLTPFSITEILHVTFFVQGRQPQVSVCWVRVLLLLLCLTLTDVFLHLLFTSLQCTTKYILNLFTTSTIVLHLLFFQPCMSSVSLKIVCGYGDDDFDSTNTSPINSCTHMTNFMLLITVFMVVLIFNGIFITSLTKDGYQRALKETMPLLILPVAAQMYAYYVRNMQHHLFSR